MEPQIREALQQLQLEYTVSMGEVWRPGDADVVEHNVEAAQELEAGIRDAADRQRSSPAGAVIVGDPGVGKTHLVRRSRKSLETVNGFFVQLDINEDPDFWKCMLAAYKRSLTEQLTAEDTQLRLLLLALFKTIDVSYSQVWTVTDGAPTRGPVDEVVAAISSKHADFDDACRDTLRMLCILSSSRIPDKDLADAWLSGKSEAAPGQRYKWGIHPEPRGAREIVLALSRILALAGPTLLAVDQVDTLVQESRRLSHESANLTEANARLSSLGSSLMDFQERTRRTFTVITCLPHSWEEMQAVGLGSVSGRFRPVRYLDAQPTEQFARAIVAAHMTSFLSDVGFGRPSRVWPVAPEAFAAQNNPTPRSMLKSITEHARRCLDEDHFRLLHSFDAGPQRESTSAEESVAARFKELFKAADVAAAVTPDYEDRQLPSLLAGGMESVGMETGRQISARSEYAGSQPGVHAVAHCDGYRWVVRGLSHEDGRSIKARFRWLRQQSGMDKHSRDGEVIMLRTGEWGATEAVHRARTEFECECGRIVDVDADDLKTLVALKALSRERPPGLREWLLDTRPASSTKLMREIFGDPREGLEPSADPPQSPTPSPPSVSHAAEASWAAVGANVPIGRYSDGATASVPLESLRKHVALFAGSGSGKTVMLRRLVEECALQGVSAIVLDPNNDLARLGDPWPQPPSSWGPGDEERAEKYLAGTEVVVWTPRVEKGRPVSFQPLPDFSAVVDDVDEFGKALDTAVAILAPRAKMDGKTDKHEQGRAVLREVLNYSAHQGSAGLDAFLELLTDLPSDVVNLDKAPEIAHSMAQTLHAARINDSLFGGTGTALDPAELLTPESGKVARISVVSLIGLPDAVQRQSFVNQLQMALFAWIKRHPAGDRPLGGLFVMDEAQTFAPSGAMTPCTESTLALASQARKYGLGLVFATQAPRGIHNQIVGNSATQLVGFLNSPTQVSAVKEMVDAKRAKSLEISALGAGEFYFRTEGRHHQKLATPMCLSHHPRSALTNEEVVERARR